MVVGIKDVFKMIGIFIISCCAVVVCTMFLNYQLDLVTIKDQILSVELMALYDAQVMIGKVVVGASGGSLLITSVIMLIFYIKHYIDTHRKELGILKALGYSNWKIVRGFWIFGFIVLVGTAVGFLGAACIMPMFYKFQNREHILPEVTMHFHFELVLYLILLPTVMFMLLSILYGYFKIKAPVLDLLRDKSKVKMRAYCKNLDLPFLVELRKSTAKQRTSLVFFITFATFCYSAMMQMSFSMEELASKLMAIMVLAIGIILALTTLFIAITTVINANKKTVAMMQTFGYSLKNCSQAILGGYRPWAYLGFVIGTAYQYGLLRTVIDVVCKDVENVPEYNFDIPAFIIAFVSFIFFYELIMWIYTQQLQKVSIKEIMLD